MVRFSMDLKIIKFETFFPLLRDGSNKKNFSRIGVFVMTYHACN